jgi:hypothetical protein
MVSQNVGAGRSVFLGIDALHQWRIRKPEDYDRFWQQLLFWLGARAQDYSIVPERDSYLPGDRVRLKVFARKVESTLRFSASGESGVEIEVPVSWNEKEGEGNAEFVVSKDDDYVFTLRNGKELLTQKLVGAHLKDMEKEYSGVNLLFLRQLAQESKGQCIAADELRTIPDLLEMKKESSLQKERVPIWHSPWIFILMLGAYMAELLFRQKYKLS